MGLGKRIDALRSRARAMSVSRFGKPTRHPSPVVVMMMPLPLLMRPTWRLLGRRGVGGAVWNGRRGTRILPGFGERHHLACN